MKRLTGKTKDGLLGIFVGLLGIALIVSLLGDAWARPYRLARVPKTEFSCGVCHVSANGGGARTSFGEEYARIALRSGDTYTEGLGAKDSDGDGYTNDQEFKAGTHPGDPASKPAT